MKYLTLTEASRVWMPDLFFSNEKEGHFHNIIMPNVYIRIFPNGLVLYSIRLAIKRIILILSISTELAKTAYKRFHKNLNNNTFVNVHHHYS